MTIVDDICDFYRKTVTVNDEETFFHRLFVHFFLNLENSNDTDHDDLLFFIHKIDPRQLKKKSIKPQIEVYRKWNYYEKNPLIIDWKDTLFLNLILQKFRYTIRISILTRTGSKHIQLMGKKFIQVFATPSQHSVLNKKIQERYSYPIMNFHLDNFEDFMYDNSVNYMDMVYIELVADDHQDDQEPFVITSFCIDYHSIDTTYLEKKSMINGQFLSVMKIFDKNRLIDSNLELVIKKKIKRSVSDNPSSGNFSTFPETKRLSSSSSQTPRPHSSSAYVLEVSNFFFNTAANHMPFDNNHRSVTIESIDLLSELNDPESQQLWQQPGFLQWYFRWKRKKKSLMNSYHCAVTNISVPCDWIVEQVLRPIKNRQRSLY